MSNDLKLQLVLETLNKASAPLKKIGLDSSKTAQQLKASRDALRQLQRQQSDISSFKKLQAAANDSATKLKAAQARTAELAAQIKATETPSKRLTARFASATKQAKKLKDAHHANREKLHAMGNALQAAGIKTQRLDRYQSKITHQIKSANDAIAQQTSKLKQLGAAQKQHAAIQSASGAVRSEAGSLAMQGGVVAAGAGVFFKTQLLDTASQFEDLEAVLRSVEGSSEKARAAMTWTSDFAAKTPYELAEITESYKQLRAYGLDPTTGLLQDLGDTAAAMNKPIMQAVEAMADAITGENERLKEFGIRASKGGGQITYEFTNKAGEQQSVSVAEDDRAAIESTLRTIWNEKFAGAMDERSRTWSGMISNMGDQWTRFNNMMMAAGLFDWMKDKLRGLLDTVDKMAADGSLQAIATEWGTNLVNIAKGAWEIGSAIASVSSTLAGFVGGWENLMLIIVAIKLTPLMTSLFALGSAIAPLAMSYLPMVLAAFKALAAFMLTNPIGIAIAAIAAAAYLIYDNWEPIKTFFTELWRNITAQFEQFVSYIGGLKDTLFTAGGEIINGLINGLTSKLGDLKDSVVGVATSASDWFKEKLGIHSPSRVFISHGSDVMSGLEKGLNNNRDTLKPLFNVSDRLKQAGAGLALGTVAMSATAFDARPPLQARTALGNGNSVSVGEIHVHAAAGMDEQALARLVAAEITKLQRSQAAARRSRLTDED